MSANVTATGSLSGIRLAYTTLLLAALLLGLVALGFSSTGVSVLLWPYLAIGVALELYVKWYWGRAADGSRFNRMKTRAWPEGDGKQGGGFVLIP